MNLRSERIKCTNLVTVPQQFIRDMRADESRAACDQDEHVVVALQANGHGIRSERDTDTEMVLTCVPNVLTSIDFG